MTNKKWREFWMKYMPGHMRDDLGDWCVCDEKCTCDTLSSKDMVHVVEIGALREAEALIEEMRTALEIYALTNESFPEYGAVSRDILKKYQAWKEGRNGAKETE